MSHSFELTEASVRQHPASTGLDEDRLGRYKKELDEFRARVADFPDREPGEILVTISGISGRLAEIRADLQRVNTPRCARLRTSEVDPLREDLDFQFRVHSRRIALLEWEFKLAGGAT